MALHLNSQARTCLLNGSRPIPCAEGVKTFLYENNIKLNQMYFNIAHYQWYNASFSIMTKYPYCKTYIFKMYSFKQKEYDMIHHNINLSPCFKIGQCPRTVLRPTKLS